MRISLLQNYLKIAIIGYLIVTIIVLIIFGFGDLTTIGQFSFAEKNTTNELYTLPGGYTSNLFIPTRSTLDPAFSSGCDMDIKPGQSQFYKFSINFQCLANTPNTPVTVQNNHQQILGTLDNVTQFIFLVIYRSDGKLIQSFNQTYPQLGSPSSGPSTVKGNIFDLSWQANQASLIDRKTTSFYISTSIFTTFLLHGEEYSNSTSARGITWWTEGFSSKVHTTVASRISNPSGVEITLTNNFTDSSAFSLLLVGLLILLTLVIYFKFKFKTPTHAFSVNP